MSKDTEIAKLDKISKAYDPGSVEKEIYAKWEKEKAFAPKPAKEKFTIMIPPPNRTGVLHMGHAMFVTLEDLMIRYNRMLGKETLWVPGTDHAGIATQCKVEKELIEKGIDPKTLSREELYKEIWNFAENSHKHMTAQIKGLGASCDWSRERYTIDEGLSKAVRKAFVKLYEEGLIYQGSYIVNWCSHCGTVIADDEVEFEQKKGKIYFVRYFVKAADKSIIVATTRPETMLGDTAIAVHPDDKRYKEFIGKEVILPVLNKEIPVIADPRVDMQFGTGAVKITPSHDPLDFEIARDHGLDFIQVIGFDGKMTKDTGKFKGLTTIQARFNVVKYLDEIGNLEGFKDHEHNVGTCYRCHETIEPLVSKQWFLKVRGMCEKAIEAVKKGDVKIIPERFNKLYFNWMENLHDWCISRQLIWGHRIPVWYGEQSGEIFVSEEDMDVNPKGRFKGEKLIQDPDVLDTWFSSALWPFSALGWPDNTEDFKKFYPTSVLETGYDILNIWVSRMIMLGIHLTGKSPFHTVYLHGLVRDEQGRKMSKSLGNGIDPLEIRDQYGTDALRISLIIGSTPGNDTNLGVSKIEGSRNFINKLWNVARFVYGKTDIKISQKPRELSDLWKNYDKYDLPTKWLIEEFNKLIIDVTEDLDNYQFGEAGNKLYDFTWNKLCDWYVEMSKSRWDNKYEEVTHTIIHYLLSLWHPFIPFVTEKIWETWELPGMLINASWPKSATSFDKEKFEGIIEQMETLQGTISLIRSLRKDQDIEPKIGLDILIYADKDCLEFLKAHQDIVNNMTNIKSIEYLTHGERPENSFSSSIKGVEVHILTSELDSERQIERLSKEIANLEKRKERFEEKLADESFVDKAPKELVKQYKDSVKEISKDLKILSEKLEKMSK